MAGPLVSAGSASLGQGKHSAHQVLNKLAPGYANAIESDPADNEPGKTVSATRRVEIVARGDPGTMYPAMVADAVGLAAIGQHE